MSKLTDSAGVEIIIPPTVKVPTVTNHISDHISVSPVTLSHYSRSMHVHMERQTCTYSTDATRTVKPKVARQDTLSKLSAQARVVGFKLPSL